VIEELAARGALWPLSRVVADHDNLLRPFPQFDDASIRKFRCYFDGSTLVLTCSRDPLNHAVVMIDAEEGVLGHSACYATRAAAALTYLTVWGPASDCPNWGRAVISESDVSQRARITPPFTGSAAAGPVFLLHHRSH